MPGAWRFIHRGWVALSAPKPVRKTDGEAKRISGVSPSSSLILAKLETQQKNTDFALWHLGLNKRHVSGVCGGQIREMKTNLIGTCHVFYLLVHESSWF